MSQNELLDTRIVKTTFVAPLQVTKARLQELPIKSTIDYTKSDVIK
jgi:hypothetical protein